MSITFSAILLIGLPDTGKSTFLAALDEILETTSDDGALRSCGFSEDRQYLQTLRNSWLAGKAMPRSTVSDAIVTLKAECPISGRRLDLILPDLMGETFKLQCELREWEVRYQEKLASIGGVMLFIHAEELAKNSHIPQTWPMGAVVPDTPKVKPVEWENRHAAPQVKVVELLQFILEERADKKPLRLAVMISAWDWAKQFPEMFDQNPDKFLKEQWPLLHQFLQMNEERFTNRVYGVSARGGGQEDDPRLQAIEYPKDRVFIVSGEETSKDLTLPLRWLMEEVL